MRFIVGILWIILMVFIILVVLKIPGIRQSTVRLRNLTRAGALVGSGFARGIVRVAVDRCGFYGE